MQAAPALVFACAGATTSSSALCAVPSHFLALRASGPNVVVVDTRSALPRVSAVLATRPGASVAGVAACVEAASSSCIAAAAALSDGTLGVWTRDERGWGNAALVAATGGGGKGATPLVTLCALYSKLENCFCVVTAAMDNANGAGLCSLWQFGTANDGPTSQQASTPLKVASTQVSPNHLLPECVAAKFVDETLLVALAGTDKAVRLYYREGSVLVPLASPLFGHRDWVRGLCFSQGNEHGRGFVLATSSTDSTIRIWRFERDLGDNSSTSESESFPDEQLYSDKDVHRARISLDLAGKAWTATLDGLLAEHDHAVLSVSFTNDASGRLTLLSASVDGSIALWNKSVPDVDLLSHEMSPWTISARFGLLGGAGAAALGFSCAAFVAQGAARVMAHTLGGSVHSWRLMEKDPTAGGEKDLMMQFTAENAPGGHVGQVNTVAWDPKGRFLVSSGEDKTTRIYAPFPSPSSVFVEWARPQVHGHPVRDVVFTEDSGRALASASEEKVIRLFDAPKQFICPGSRRNHDDDPGRDDSHVAMSASLPELGLSNKPVYNQASNKSFAENNTAEEAWVPEVDDDEGGASTIPGGLKDETGIETFGAVRDSNFAPLEPELRQRRLWPERAKLYGHGNDLSCLAVDLTCGVLASACRAQASRDACIILWDVESGLEKARLFAHDLTVNQLRFTKDGNSLLSVARDRSFAVFDRASAETRESGGNFSFALSVRVQESHGRLLHAGCWMQDGKFICTGSRDKTLKLWLYENTTATELLSRKFSSGVSSLDASSLVGNESRAYIAIGLEDGGICIASVQFSSAPDVTFTMTAKFPASLQCCGRVESLAWKPLLAAAPSPSGREYQLAVASADHSVRIFQVFLADG
jgi:elongator complex protein 2